MANLEHNISKLEHYALKVVQKIQQSESEKQELNERVAGIVSLFENAGLADAAPAQENELNSESAPTGGLLEYNLKEAEGADE